MVRKIIRIDTEKCDGCGICAEACHEGAIGMVDGKATLLRDDYCDGLGDCLPTCPTGAITFVEREAAEYDEEAVKENMRRREVEMNMEHMHGHHEGHTCPGAAMRQLNPEGGAPAPTSAPADVHVHSQLKNWPVQIKLAPITAPYFDGAKLLVAADCTAFSYAAIHSEYMRGKVTLIGCPKLDDMDYSEKLCEIIKNNDIQSVTIMRMEVPCCGGLQMMVQNALQESGKFIPWQVVTVSIDGHILDM